MTFSYDGTIPNPPDDPADDVDQMQTNSASISSIMNVDHYGFNDPYGFGGTHRKVTFSGNNVPTVPTTPPVLFTDVLNALPALFFYSGNAAHTSDQYVASGNGSSLQLGGMIVKWGTASFSGVNDTLAITFTTAFPNNTFYASAIGETTTASKIPAIAVSSITTAGFTITRSFSGISGLPVRYVAIGN